MKNISSALAGGNFFTGMASGIISAGLNHLMHAGARGVGDAIMEHQEEVRQQNRDRPPESRRATQYDTKEEALAQAEAWAKEWRCEIPVNEVDFNKGVEGVDPNIKYVISPWVNNTRNEAYIPPEISAISTKQWHFALEVNEIGSSLWSSVLDQGYSNKWNVPVYHIGAKHTFLMTPKSYILWEGSIHNINTRISTPCYGVPVNSY